MPTPETICPSDHAHGASTNCVTSHGCRCGDCRAARREYMYWHRHMIAAGRDDVFNRRVDATGTRRRIQALMCLGWSQSALERRSGIQQKVLSDHLYRDYVSTRSRDRIAELYEQLSHLIPPTENAGQRISVNKARAYARRHGWAPPLAWDDIDNDPEPATAEPSGAVDEVAVDLAVHGHPVHLTPAERRACVVLLHAQYWSDSRIADTIRCTSKTVERIRAELHLAAHDQNDLIDRSAAA